MRKAFLIKRCEGCNEQYSILRVREGRTQELIIRFAVCPHCNPNAHACVACRVPFDVVKHSALGMCWVCYMYHWRQKRNI